MEKSIITLLIFIIALTGCTKTVYVEKQADNCPIKCINSFNNEYGSCKEHLDSLRDSGRLLNFNPDDFECDNSRKVDNECSCSCNCGLIYQFNI